MAISRLVLVVFLFSMVGAVSAGGPAPDARPEISVAELPREARETISLIGKGGPFPFPRDGVVFGNFEDRLPAKARGYYREYTVRTPGAKGRSWRGAPRRR